MRDWVVEHRLDTDCFATSPILLFDSVLTLWETLSVCNILKRNQHFNMEH